VLDAVASPRLEGLDSEVVIADITDADAVAAACEGMDAVLHLAVLPLTAANSEHEVAFRTNVRGSFNVFRSAGEQGVKRVVYSSASSAYGPTSVVPIREDHPLRPNAFYPATKAAAEMLLRGLAGAYGYSYAILRYMNVYGPGQRAGVVPAVARRMLAGERPQLSGDGTQGFDFVHIEDCAQANLLALRAEVSGEDFNVGHGTSASLNELVALVGELLENQLEPVYKGEATPVPPRVGDVTKPRELLGFSAGIALRDGLQTVLDELRATETAGVS
jgi:UDP-glucose 4-epimerase